MNENVTPLAVPAASQALIYQKKILIVTPWQKHTCPLTSFSVTQLTDRRRTSSMMNFGDAFVAHSRNTCADVFLTTDCEWMLSIDDDMLVPFGNGKWFTSYSEWQELPMPFREFNAIDRLMSHKKTLVGALYFGRSGSRPPVYAEGATDRKEAEYANTAPIDLIKPTKWVGTGCILTHRSVFEDIEKKFPRLARKDDFGKRGGNWFTSTEASLLEKVQQAHDKMLGKPLTGELAYQALSDLADAIAHARADNPLGAGEDVSFCLRAASAGHQPFVDMGLVCGHIGTKIYGPKKYATD